MGEIRNARCLLLQQQWNQYGDPPVDLICRSLTGSITPITTWILYADHQVDPMGRSLTSLFNRQAFCLDAEVMAFVIRHFMGQLVDLYLPPVEFLIIARDDFCLLAYQFAQFVRSQMVKVGRQCHDRHDAKLSTSRLSWTSPMVDRHKTRITPPSASLSQGKPRISASNCPRVSVTLPSPGRS